MIKISALNEESHEESEEENAPSITKEAQEQLALTEYNKALQFLKEDQIDEALNILKDLIETELLDQVEKPLIPDGRTRPMLSLKYCCYKNIGGIYRKMGNYEEAIDNYWEAANLDDSDVMLWYTMGILAMKTLNLEFAGSAFKQALVCNSNHWPSLDNIITVMYAIPDYMNCLLYISLALQRDPTYIKGLMFREKIFKNIPYFEESYKLFNEDWTSDPPLTNDFDRIIGDKLLIEAQEIAEKWIDVCKSDFLSKPVPSLSINVPLKNFTWLELGESLIDMYDYIVINNLNFASKIKLEIDKIDHNKTNSQSSSHQELKINECQKITTIEVKKLEEDEKMIISNIESEIIIDDEINNATKRLENDDKNNQSNINQLNSEESIEIKSDEQMEIEIIDEDDNKSSSSDIHIIESEDPLKIELSELEDPGQFENKLNNSHKNNNTCNNNNNNNNNDSSSSSSCSSNSSSGTSNSSNSNNSSSSINNGNVRLIEDDTEMVKLSNDECHVFIDKVTDILDDKFNKNDETLEKFKADINDDVIKISDNDNTENNQNSNKLNDDNIKNTTTEITTNGKSNEEQQKVKKRRRSSLCFLQQWAWSSSSMRRSARVRGSSKREIEREDVQLEEIMRRLFPQNLLPDTVKLTKDDPLKNIDDSMDTMDLYQLFANQEKHDVNNISDDSNDNDNHDSGGGDDNDNINNDGDNDNGDQNENIDNDGVRIDVNELNNINNGNEIINNNDGGDNNDENKLNFKNFKLSNMETVKKKNNNNKRQYFDTEAEKKQVVNFINEHSGKSNIMIIIGKLTELLSTKWHYVWPSKLSDIYQQLYVFTRRHIPHNNNTFFLNINENNDDKNDNILINDAEMSLLFCEIYTDKWLNNKSDTLVRSKIDKFGIGLPSEELGYILFSTVYYDNENLSNNIDNLLYLLRVLWVKVNIFLCQGDTKMVIKSLESIIDLMENSQNKLPHELSIRLPNCKYNSRITLSIVKKRLMSIERSEKLGQVEKLYEEKKFYELSLILKDTFKYGKSANKQQSVNEMQTTLFLNNMKLISIDRTKQFSMLLESLWQLQQYEDCYFWCEICLNEAWQYYTSDPALNTNEPKKWSSSILNCLEKLELCVEMAGTSVSRYLPDSKTSRLIQTLIQIICHQLDVSENTIEMPLETVTPWILLHHILQYQDDKERATRSRNAQKYKNKKNKIRKIKQTTITSTTITIPSTTNNFNDNQNDNEDNGVTYDTDLDTSSTTVESNTDKDNNNIPSPIMILFIGHDFLGRHSWCCIDEAKLLLFTIKTVIPCMCSPRYYCIREKITKHLEQIFWCLYGHPNRTNKTKPKHLEDHGVPQIPLTWDIAQLLFEFYKPDILPEFDTPKAMSISSDTKILFKKINSLVPQEHDPSGMIEQITAYIVGEIEEMPRVGKPLPYQVDTLYYLLGDYTFKNNNWISATKYYTMDICLHQNAFNSWVALAMSVSTLIGTALNNCKPLMDIMKLLYQAKVAQCCYHRAVELKPGHSVIWIEYGNFVYMVHSFCSRLLKQESDTLSMEKFSILETRKEKTLEIAANCFVSANRIYLANIDDSPEMQDERWLYYYMLAKIAEKKNTDPTVYLQHYATASELLHKNNAHYPKKISHKNAHYLSIEALEVHYRIHASILKYFEQHDNKPLKKSLGQLFLKHLLDCANGPFMQYQSKLTKNKYYRDENPTDISSTITTKAYQDKLSSINDNKNVKNQFYDNVQSVTSKKSIIQDNKIQSQNNCDDIIVLSTNCGNKNTDLNKSKNDNVSNNNNNNKKRMRQSDEHLIDSECTKRVKLGNVSHLQLMQEVVAFIDDLISNVCDMVASKQDDEKQLDSDQYMVISSDESGEFNESNNKDDQLLEVDNEIQVITDNQKKLQNNQDIQIINEQIDKSQLKENSTVYSNNKEKNVKDNKYSVDKKKTQVNTVKDEATMSRRGSQESTTTTLTNTTNETNNSSFSSSDESSSSEDSSDSDSSSADSDSESAESDNDKKKINNQADEKEEEEEYFTEAEVGRLIAYCLAGLEQCVLRFPEHYKSIYRLCHFYFNYKSSKDNNKCRDLLLGTYKCQYYTGLNFQGLFADRKSTNFFNGVWRIPNDEIDRPGSFASHMSRCTTLLLQVLKETEDSRTLMELCIQLRKTPDHDKKYVRDSEREQLSRQAFSLCLQSLRTRVQTMGLPNVDDNISLAKSDPRTRILLDVYKTYQQVQKNFQGKEVQAFATLLVDTYKVYINIKSSEGNILEMAIRFCQQQALANKIAVSQASSHYNHNIQQQTSPSNNSSTVNYSGNTSVITVASSTHTYTNTNTISNTITTTTTTNILTANPSSMSSQSFVTSPQTSYHRKTSYKTSGTGRPRGRPPNTNKYIQNFQQQSGNPNNLMDQYRTKANFANNYLGTPGNQSLINPYFMNPLMDQNMISTLLTAGLTGNMLESLSTVNYLKSIGYNYHDFIRQYQNNLTSISNSLTSNFNNPTMSYSSNTTLGGGVSSSNIGANSNITSGIENIGNMTVQQLLNLNASSAAAGCTTNTTSTTHNTVANITSTNNITTTGSTTITTTTRTTNINSGSSTIKDKSHNISITPVSSNHNQPKPLKSMKHDLTNHNIESISGNIMKNIHPTKTMSQSGMAQVSLLKTSVVQSNKTASSKQLSSSSSSSSSAAAAAAGTATAAAESSGQIRVAKNLTESQPIHNSSSLSLSPIKSSSPSSIIAGIPSSLTANLQNSGLNIKPVPAGSLPRMNNSGTSLQHKLQLKKQSQIQPSQQSLRKHKLSSNKSMNSHPTISNTYQSNVSAINPSTGTMINNAFTSGELSGLSVSPVNNLDSSKSSISKHHHHHHHQQRHQPYSNIKKSSTKLKSTSSEKTDSIQSCLPSSHTSSVITNATAETLNMLSQLQQHSHLEIIPQSKNLNTKVTNEYSKNKSLSLSVVQQKSGISKNLENPHGNNSDSIATVYEVPVREKTVLSSSSSKKSDKISNMESKNQDNVEIITLDD